MEDNIILPAYTTNISEDVNLGINLNTYIEISLLESLSSTLEIISEDEIKYKTMSSYIHLLKRTKLNTFFDEIPLQKLIELICSDEYLLDLIDTSSIKFFSKLSLISYDDLIIENISKILSNNCSSSDELKNLILPENLKSLVLSTNDILSILKNNRHLSFIVICIIYLNDNSFAILLKDLAEEKEEQYVV